MQTLNAKAVLLVAGFAAAACSVCITQVIVEARRGDRPQIVELFLERPTKDRLRAFEQDIESRCWLSQQVRPYVQLARFRAMGDLGEKALAGRDGWLFYKPAVQYLVEPWQVGPGDRDEGLFPAVLSFRDQLAHRGIRLMVVIAPNKASVYPDMLCARISSGGRPVNGKTLDVIAGLRQAGIDVVNLFEAFSQARVGEGEGDRHFYLAQDSHWSPRGAELAARVVARRIMDSGLVQKGTSRYELRPVTVRRHGDIIQMAQVRQIADTYEPEALDCTQVVEGDTGRPYKDDPASPVLVLGDSFLRIYERDEPGTAGFLAHLSHELALPVASIVNDGGASTLVRQELARKAGLLAGKKMVVWEFVERDIRFGTEGWQTITLP